MGTRCAHLDLEERQRLARWREAKLPMKEIALQLGRFRRRRWRTRGTRPRWRRSGRGSWAGPSRPPAPRAAPGRVGVPASGARLGPRLGPPAPEPVVEDLEAHRPAITGGHHRPHEGRPVEIALARHVAEVARPVEQVHLDHRRVLQLPEGYPGPGIAPDRLEVEFAVQRVEAVEDRSGWSVRQIPQASR